MENTAIRRGKVEMSVVCSDLSLLENINSLLKDNGFISVEDEQGIMHYIVDGRRNRKEAAGKVTSLGPNKKTTQGKEEAYIDMCVKSVLREYGFDMSLIGTASKKDVLFIIGDWNAKVGSQEKPGVTGKFGLGVQNEAGQRLIEFCYFQ